MLNDIDIAAGAPFYSVDDVALGLAALEGRYLATDDRRAAFVTAYRVITETLRQWLRQGRFADCQRTAAYVVAFANRHQQALCAYDSGDLACVSAPWRLAFDAAGEKRISWMQSLLLGINAHINYDLPFAVLDAGLNVACTTCYADHTYINLALRRSTTMVRRRVLALYEPSLVTCLAGRVFGSVIDDHVGVTFEQAREAAWTWARRLHTASPVARRHTDAELNLFALQRARRILGAQSANSSSRVDLSKAYRQISVLA